MIFALDTNVILDILYKDEEFHEKSREVLEKASENGFFIVSPEVYAEVATAFSMNTEKWEDELEKFLEKKNIQLVEHNPESLKLAGKKWKEYDASESVQCPSCGKKQTVKCSCGKQINWRNHLITDFMIGAHAKIHADKLITRDNGYYTNYFDPEIHYS